MTEYMVEQQIPFPSKLVYGYKAEKRRAEAFKSREAMTAQEIVRQIKHAYADAWRLQEEKRINRQTLSIYRQNKGVTETAYATLKGNVADPVRASVDLGEIEGQLALIEQEQIASVANLSSLISETLDPSTTVAEPHEPPAIAGLDELIETARAARPEISEADKMVASESANLSKAKSQYGPDLTLRWGYVDMPGNLQNAWTGRIGVSVPLWSLSKQSYGVKESKAMLMRAESLKAEAELGAEADVKSSYARLAAAKKVMRVYSGNVIPRARLLLSSSQEAYRSGKGDFLSVVDSIRSLNNAQLMLVRARADAVVAYSDLERAVGTNPAKERTK
jgi:outer membrane protein TolC